MQWYETGMHSAPAGRGAGRGFREAAMALIETSDGYTLWYDAVGPRDAAGIVFPVRHRG